ncbi:hypothetical protein Pmani_026739 [Petrolisthes manimaculis]|uniref:PH domain-containing protein n=1 Tax=Petrolisthes manimaculis TaxID=1843537 RepID=A0AAE1P441_9EUCA|nr:hypothetical protein Pmani_026739 [Petrolisthes manimaculis]
MCDSEDQGTIGDSPKIQRRSSDSTDVVVPPQDSVGNGNAGNQTTPTEMTSETISSHEHLKESYTTNEKDKKLENITQGDSNPEDVSQDDQEIIEVIPEDPSPDDKSQKDSECNEGTEEEHGQNNGETDNQELHEDLQIEHPPSDCDTQESQDLVDGVHRNLRDSQDSMKEKPSEEESKKLEKDPELEKSTQDTPEKLEVLEIVKVSTKTQLESPRVSRGERQSRESCEGVRASSSGQDDGSNGEEVEGVDPFSVAPGTVTQPSRPTKSVNFKEDIPTENGGSPHSSTPHQREKVEEEKEEDKEEEKKEDKKPSRHKALGDGNPVYRLSMKLSPNLFNMMDIPGASQHVEAEKAGYLNKLSGRSFPYIPQWKRRYCVLSKGRLYYYEREDSRQGEKANGVINLEYFDQVTEAAPKECKKATNVFIITSQDRSFFDPGRHLFSADTLPDMKDWIRRLQAALEQIRNNNRPAAAAITTTTTSMSAAGKESGKKRKEESSSSVAETKEDRENHTSSTKDRKKKKEDSQRPRKSARTGVSSETQTSMADTACEQEAATAAQNMATSPKGGIQLPGLSTHKPKPAVKDDKPVQKPAAVTRSQGKSEDLPQAGPTLSCVTKLRVKGPSGRRAPQSQRRTMAAALKQRASSLSALEHQDAGDNRSDTSQGWSGSQRDSRTPDGDLKEEEEKEKEKEEEEEQKVEISSPERQVVFDDIDGDLFFKSRLGEGGDVMGNGDGTCNNNSKKVKGQSSTLRVNFEDRDHRRSNSHSRSGTLSNKLTRFISFKRTRFESKDAAAAEHPDMVEQSRWSCSIL